MNLFECLDEEFQSKPLGVPSWTLGCFRRRSITFFDGATEGETRVFWLQSHNLSFDLRVLPGRFRPYGPKALSHCSAAEVLSLIEAEGGLAHTQWDGEKMAWLDWTSFQTHAKWPEPGVLRRVGDCLVEFAPSGAYVEDWRLQPAVKGPLIGLELIEERDLDRGTLLHRGGGLIVCGPHAGFVRGRAEPLPDKPLQELVRDYRRNAAALSDVFAFEASYAYRAQDTETYTVMVSTSPWREAKPLLSLDGFSFDYESQELVQRVREAGVHLQRRFRIDTLEASFEGAASTPAAPEARAWLEREAPTLLRHAQRAGVQTTPYI